MNFSVFDNKLGWGILLTLVVYYLIFFGWFFSTLFFLFDYQKFNFPEELHHNSIPHNDTFIPRIFHHLYKTEDLSKLPPEWLKCYLSCLEKYPTNLYNHILWTDEKMDKWILENFPEDYNSYRSYPYMIQKVDVFRYYVLLKMGGIYVDMDIGCNKPLEFLHHLPYPATIWPETSPMGVSNDFIASSPNHPFFRYILHQLPNYNWHWGFKTATVLFSTGPTAINRMLFYYDENTKHLDMNEKVFILPEKYYSSPSGSYFYHVTGCSWHEWDATVIMYVYMGGWRYGVVLAVVMGCLWYIYRKGEFYTVEDYPLNSIKDQ